MFNLIGERKDRESNDMQWRQVEIIYENGICLNSSLRMRVRIPTRAFHTNEIEIVRSQALISSANRLFCVSIVHHPPEHWNWRHSCNTRTVDTLIHLACRSPSQHRNSAQLRRTHSITFRAKLRRTCVMCVITARLQSVPKWPNASGHVHSVPHNYVESIDPLELSESPEQPIQLSALSVQWTLKYHNFHNIKTARMPFSSHFYSRNAILVFSSFLFVSFAFFFLF